ncbi:MAG: hypothetical protein ACI9ZF_001301 [Bradyrhizobium sp.]|jgi:hypothetical protein
MDKFYEVFRLPANVGSSGWRPDIGYANATLNSATAQAATPGACHENLEIIKQPVNN